jgi:hypothetical protein
MDVSIHSDGSLLEWVGVKLGYFGLHVKGDAS